MSTDYFYNMAFNFYLVSKIKTSLKGKNIRTPKIHITALVISFFITFLNLIFKNNGKNMNGTCFT